MLGTKRSTPGSTRCRNAFQSIFPEGLFGSGRLMSSDVRAPCARARSMSRPRARAAVRPDLLHERGVPEMEEPRVLRARSSGTSVSVKVSFAPGQWKKILSISGGLSTMVYELASPVDTGEAPREVRAIPAILSATSLPSGSSADARHKAHRQSRGGAGRAHVGDGTSGGNDGRIHDGKPSRAKPVLPGSHAGNPGMMSRQRCPQTTTSRAELCAMAENSGGNPTIAIKRERNPGSGTEGNGAAVADRARAAVHLGMLHDQGMKLVEQLMARRQATMEDPLDLRRSAPCPRCKPDTGENPPGVGVHDEQGTWNAYRRYGIGRFRTDAPLARAAPRAWARSSSPRKTGRRSPSASSPSGCNSPRRG